MYPGLLFLCLLAFISSIHLEVQADPYDSLFIEKPQLYKKIPIPEKFLLHTDGLTYGGDIRMGDLQNLEEASFLVYRTAHSVDGGAPQPCFIGAFTQEGLPLWQKGKGGLQPNRPGPVAIFDIDADGKTEVITLFANNPEITDPFHLQNMSIQILDGATGKNSRVPAIPHARTPVVFLVLAERVPVQCRSW